MSTNQFTITGLLAKDPELKFSQAGKAFCRITVPDQKAVKNDAGEWENKSDTLWVTATVFGDQAEALAECAVKGDEVIVTGRLIARNWEGKDGSKQVSLEVDFARVAVAPKARSSYRQQAGQQSAQADPWGGVDREPAPF